MYQLQLLKSVDLSNNAFTGELPASWGNLNNIQELQLQNNKLYGTLPASWQSMWSLKRLNLSYNTFTVSFDKPQAVPGVLQAAAAAAGVDSEYTHGYCMHRPQYHDKQSHFCHVPDVVCLCYGVQGGLPVEWHNPMMPNFPGNLFYYQYYPRMYALQELACTSCGLSGTLPNW